MTKGATIALVFIIVVLTATSAHGATLDQVIAKMQGYQKVNTAMPSVLGASASATTSVTPTAPALRPEQSQVIVEDLRSVTGKRIGGIVTKRVSYGMTNDQDVRALQAFLCAKGYLDPCVTSGTFGVQTKAALQKFQSQNGITGAGSDGSTVGDRTMWALSASY